MVGSRHQKHVVGDAKAKRPQEMQGYVAPSTVNPLFAAISAGVATGMCQRTMPSFARSGLFGYRPFQIHSGTWHGPRQLAQ